MQHNDGVIELHNKKYKVVTLDFETFYSQDYTLSGKMNTSEYVRDERFKAHGVGIKVGSGGTYWYSRQDEIASALYAIDWANSAVLCHNTAFDGFILYQRYGIVPGLYLDTLSMARAIHGHHLRHNLDFLAKLHGLGGKVKAHALTNTKGKEELTEEEAEALGEYCIDDVNDTYELFWKFYDYMPDNELRLVDITMRMFCEPILELDSDRIKRELKAEVSSKKAAIDAAGVGTSELSSNNKFAELLRAEGIEPPTKISPTTGKSTFAFSKSDLDFQKLLKHENPRIAALCEARVKAKSTIGETRANRFLHAGEGNYKFPILLNYCGAHTHRWSGGNKMNLQNLVRGGELRRSILAPKGHVLVVADAAQIEARINAWLAGQADVVDAFANKQDVYKLMASAIYGVPVDQVDGDKRFVGKVAVLGLGYGMGAAKLQNTLAVGAMGPPVAMSLAECKRIVNIYRYTNNKIFKLWAEMDKVIFAMTVGKAGTFGPMSYDKGYIQMPSGLFLHYPDLHTVVEESASGFVNTDTTYLGKKGARLKLYGGLLTENVVQSLARCVIAEHMLKVHDAGYRIATMTHDEIVAVAPKDKAERCYEDMINIMSECPVWAQGLPLSADGGWDECYSK
jgi:DNA polymerase I-like protein with 3'-5' exonuclease and polymerase domains